MRNETTLYRSTQIVWYIFYFIETVLALRFILRLLAANPAAWFTDLVYSISAIFVAPFRFVFATNAITSTSVIEWSTILAMIIYWILAWGIIKLLLMNKTVTPIEANQELREQEHN